MLVMTRMSSVNHCLTREKVNMPLLETELMAMEAGLALSTLAASMCSFLRAILMMVFSLTPSQAVGVMCVIARIYYFQPMLEIY